MDVSLEVGSKRVFAGAIEWPGWCRRGRSEDEALEQLLAYRPRYRAALGSRARGLPSPHRLDDLTVVARVRGDATTDFGAPGRPLDTDARAVDARELKRLTGILDACWRAFDAAAGDAVGVTLRTGPRGGGRTVAKMIEHVREAEAAYASALGGRASGDMAEVRAAFLDALEQRARGDIPDRGPRGGVRWSPRYAVRRSAWHALDHAWEIEDRHD